MWNNLFGQAAQELEAGRGFMGSLSVRQEQVLIEIRQWVVEKEFDPAG